MWPRYIEPLSQQYQQPPSHSFHTNFIGTFQSAVSSGVASMKNNCRKKGKKSYVLSSQNVNVKYRDKIKYFLETTSKYVPTDEKVYKVPERNQTT